MNRLEDKFVGVLPLRQTEGGPQVLLESNSVLVILDGSHDLESI